MPPLMRRQPDRAKANHQTRKLWLGPFMPCRILANPSGDDPNWRFRGRSRNTQGSVPVLFVGWHCCLRAHNLCFSHFLLVCVITRNNDDNTCFRCYYCQFWSTYDHFLSTLVVCHRELGQLQHRQRPVGMGGCLCHPGRSNWRNLREGMELGLDLLPRGHQRCIYWRGSK
jgi:hypothetical protein